MGVFIQRHENHQHAEHPPLPLKRRLLKGTIPSRDEGEEGEED